MDIRRQFIYDTGLPPVASFTTDPEIAEGVVPLTVAFTDTSTNDPTSWLWNVSGGTEDVDYVYTVGSETSQNPTIRFDTIGDYSITLIAYNSAGSGTSAPDSVSVDFPANMIMWLRADGLVTGATNSYGTVDGSGNVTQWTDLSGSGNHATYDGAIGTTPNLAGTNGTNNRKGITFNGSGDNLQIPKTLFNNKAGGSMFVICKTSSIISATENEIVHFSANGSSNGRFTISVDLASGRYRTRNRRLDADTYLNSRQMLGQLALPTASTVLGLSMSWSTAYAIFYQDGEIINWETDMVQTPGNTSATNSTYASIGRLNDGTNYPFNGVISEVILFDRALSVSECNYVNAYLQSFYGIATPADHAEDPIMTAYLAQLTAQSYPLPSANWQTKMNNFWAKQRIVGNVDIFDRFGCFETEDQLQSLPDFIDPSIELVLIDTPSWNIRGYSGNGSSDAIDPQWSPSNGVNFQQDRAIAGAYGRKVGTDNGVILGCKDASTNTKLYPRWTDGKIYGGINQTAGTTASEVNYSAFGISWIKREDASDQQVGIDNDQLKNITQSSKPLTTTDMRLLCNNNNGVDAEFYTGQISMWFSGDGAIDIDGLVVDYKTFEAGIGILS